jgi:hypothetical protein
MIYRAYPAQPLKNIRATGLPERVYKEIKCRAKKVGASANDASVLRPVVSIFIDNNKEWITQNRYLPAINGMICPDNRCFFLMHYRATTMGWSAFYSFRKPW